MMSVRRGTLIAAALAGIVLLAGCKQSTPPVSQQVATPTFAPGEGTFSADQSVSIACATANATIYYTTDGTTPSATSPVFDPAAPIVVSGVATSVTVAAYATASGMLDSAVTTATYTIISPSVAFAQLPASPAGLVPSSCTYPTVNISDEFAYDNFTLASDTQIVGVHWRGGYSSGTDHASNFWVTFYETNTTGTQPDAENPHSIYPQFPESYAPSFSAAGTAGETAAGTFGGIAMYDYQLALSPPFNATGGKQYWIRIEAIMPANPTWGIAAGTSAEQTPTYYRNKVSFEPVPGGTSFVLLK